MATSTVAKMEILTRGKKENGLPEYMSEGSQNTLLGDDVWLSCYLAKFDSWYERNVLLAVQNTLRVIPAVSLVGGHYSLALIVATSC